MKAADGAAVVGIGAAACAVCCAGSILGLLAAIGLGTALGVAVFGLAGLVIAILGIPLISRRKRHRRCAPGAAVPVSTPTLRNPS
jgi:hypothetical protein